MWQVEQFYSLAIVAARNEPTHLFINTLLGDFGSRRRVHYYNIGGPLLGMVYMIYIYIYIYSQCMYIAVYIDVRK